MENGIALWSGVFTKGRLMIFDSCATCGYMRFHASGVAYCVRDCLEVSMGGVCCAFSRDPFAALNFWIHEPRVGCGGLRVSYREDGSSDEMSDV